MYDLKIRMRSIMRKTKCDFIIFIITFASLFHPAFADTDMENASLARIKQVLNSLTPLINEAEHQQNVETRVQFRYDWLRKDIKSIKNGIDEKSKQIPIEPRNVMPLQGDYLTYKHKTLK